MEYKATGQLHKIFATEQKSASFSAREFVIEMTEGKFPQMVKFQLTQDRCTLIDGYSEGDEVVVDFDLQGREWNGRYFTNLTAWRITKADGQTAAPEQDAGPQAAELPPADDYDDEIPF